MRLMTVTIFLCAFVQILSADAILNFSGLQNGEDVLDFYYSDAGSGSYGDNGTDYQIEFKQGFQIRVTGSYGTILANLPDGAPAAVGLVSSSEWVNNFASPFTSFSFDYSSPTSVQASVDVRSNIVGSGTLLGSVTLSATGTNCGDSTAQFSCWTHVTVPFTGEAQSVVFRNAENNSVYFTNLTFGTATLSSSSAVPEPSSGSLAVLGIAVALGASYYCASRRNRAETPLRME